MLRLKLVVMLSRVALPSSAKSDHFNEFPMHELVANGEGRKDENLMLHKMKPQTFSRKFSFQIQSSKRMNKQKWSKISMKVASSLRMLSVEMVEKVRFDLQLSISLLFLSRLCREFETSLISSEI